jgi:hypothetical protein
MIPSRMIARCFLAGIAVVVVLLSAVKSVDAFVTAPPAAAATSCVASPSRFQSTVTPASAAVAEARRGRERSTVRLHGLFGNNDASTAADKTTTVIASLKANEVKVGALRFLLQIYLVGEQNNPAPNSWLTKAGDDSGELLAYYGDGTGMVKIRLRESGIEFQRVGEKPSLPYLLQESVLLHGILDELEHVAFGVEDIDETKRLLRLSDPGALASERAKLPARQLGS